MSSSKKPTVSIIMPTLNSEKTIEMSLKSIREQDFDQQLIEIVIADGGSTDRTRELADTYGARVIENPRIQPECAKHEGIQKANGKYAIFLDSDEVFSSKKAISNRIKILEENSDVKFVLTGGYKKPAGYPPINDYINIFSDPFSFFMYGVSSDARYYISDMRKRYHVTKETSDYSLLDFTSASSFPLVDICAGNTLDLNYFRSTFASRLNDVCIIPEAFSLIIDKKPLVPILKNDWIIHYSADSFTKYINKITWRVVVNTHYKDSVGVGFSNREKYQNPLFKIKKYIFIPYSLSVVFPIITSIYYFFSRKTHIAFFLAPLTIFTGYYIVYQQILAILHIKPKQSAYGK